MSVKKIPLTKKRYALVDDKDYELVLKYKWYALKIGQTYYAFSSSHTTRPISMHSLIMGTPPEGKEIDHINHPGTDNRRCNLRFATRQQNSWNQKLRATNKSGIKGVMWEKSRQLWKVYLRVNYKMLNIGRYKTFEEAVAVITAARKKYHGEFARIK